MSVTAPQVTAPFLADGSFDGHASIVNVAGLVPGATVVAQASTQPDKVGLIGTIVGNKVQVLSIAGDGKIVDLSSFRVADGAQLLMPSQTVASIPSLASEVVAGDQTVGGNLAVTGTSVLTGNTTVTGTLHSGAATLASAVVTAGATVGTTLGVTGLATLTGGAAIGDGANVAVATGTGTQIATATGQKLGFWGHAPVVQQVLATGAAHSADDIITFLQAIGLCKQS